MIELAVSFPEEGLHFKVFTLRQDLTADIIDARHILTIESSEVVSQRHPGLGVGVVVFNDMTDVFYAMFSAPVSDLFGEIFPHELCDSVHICIADLCGFFRMIVVPEPQKLRCIVFTKSLLQFFLKLIGPWKIGLCAQTIGTGHVDAISKFRFIGKETEYRLSEVFLVVSVVCFIDRIDQYPAGFL